jgi:hypothetical protein
VRTRIDFISNKTPLNIWRLAVLAVGLILLTFACTCWLSAQSRRASLENLLESSAGELRRAERRDAAQRVQQPAPRELAAVARAVAQLNTPVMALTQAVVPPADIAVAVVNLDFSNGTTDGKAGGQFLKLVAEAKSYDDMTNYLSYLNAQRRFQQVRIAKYETQVNVPERPVRFQLEVAWRK